MECDACKEENSSCSSVCYCKDCKDYLCQQHLDDHKASRSARNHVTISLSERNAEKITEDSTMECDACKEENSSRSSVCYCKNCKDYLCQKHLDDHKASRSARNHVTIPLSEKNAEMNYVAIKNFWENKSKETSTPVNKTRIRPKSELWESKDPVVPDPGAIISSVSPQKEGNQDRTSSESDETAEESTSYNTSTNAGGSEDYASSEMLQKFKFQVAVQKREEVNYSDKETIPKKLKRTSSSSIGNNREVDEVKQKETTEKSTSYNTSTNAGGSEEFASSEMMQKLKFQTEVQMKEDDTYTDKETKPKELQRTSSSYIGNYREVDEVKQRETAEESTSYNTSTNAGGSEDHASSDMMQAAVQKKEEVTYSDKDTTSNELKHSPSSSIGNNKEVDEVTLKETAEESSSDNTSTNASGIDDYPSSEMLQANEVKLKETAEESTSYNNSTNAGSNDDYVCSEMLQFQDKEQKKEEVTYDKDTTPNELQYTSSSYIENHRGDANRTISILSIAPDVQQQQISKYFDEALKVKNLLQQKYDEHSTNDEQSDILSESGTDGNDSILSSASESGTDADSSFSASESGMEVDSSFTEDYYTSYDPADAVSEVGSTVTIVGQSPIEFMVEVYLPQMKHVINVGDIITSLHFVSKRDADLILSKHKFCASDAFVQLIKVIRKNYFAGKWQTFLDALGQTDYEHIKLLLENKTEIHHQHNSEILKLLAPELKKRMDVPRFIDETFETGLLTEKDKAEAQAQLREHGEYAAADVIIERVDKHKRDWNTILIKIMEKDEHSLSDMADCFKMIQQTEQNTEPKGATDISKTKRYESLEQRDWRLQNLKVAEPHVCNESSLENPHEEFADGNASSRRDDSGPVKRKDFKRLTSEMRKVRKSIEKK